MAMGSLKKLSVGRGDVFAAAIVAAPVLLFACFAWYARWLGDDGFINLRVARNVLQGHGLVFNLGERVEAFTSPLWLFALVGMGGVGVPLEWAAVAMGYVLSVSGLALATLGAWTLDGSERLRLGDLRARAVLPLGALVYTVIPPSWEYATSGLESGMSVGWLGGTFYVVARCVRMREPWAVRRRKTAVALVGASWLAGLGPLVRPELAMASAAFLVPLALVAWKLPLRPRIVLLAGMAVVAAVLPIAYELCRLGYYAALTSSTALAKEAFRSNWQQGWNFFRNFFGLYGLLVPLALLAPPHVASLRRALADGIAARSAALAAPTVCGLLYVLYVVRVGGDFMPGRLFLPGVFCLLMPVAVVPLRPEPDDRVSPALLGTGAALLVVWAIVVATVIRVARENENGIGDEPSWYARGAQVDNPVLLGDYARFHFHRDATSIRATALDHCPSMDAASPDGRRVVLVDHRNWGSFGGGRTKFPLAPEAVDPRVVMVAHRGAMGICGNVLGREILLVDHHGLADPIAARLQVAMRGRPGHEKGLLNAWVVARFAQESSSDEPAVVAARAALRCDQVPALLDAIRQPLTFARFVANMRAAPTLQKLRIPADPFEARRVLCGSAHTEPPPN